MNITKILLSIAFFLLFVLKILFIILNQEFPLDGLAWGICLITACKFLAEGLEEDVDDG